jgi:hypothetical protein
VRDTIRGLPGGGTPSDLSAAEPFPEITHEAMPAYYSIPALGAVSIRLSAVPADATRGAPVHGVLDATLPSTTGGAPVTLHAEF